MKESNDFFFKSQNKFIKDTKKKVKKSKNKYLFSKRFFCKDLTVSENITILVNISYNQSF